MFFLCFFVFFLEVFERFMWFSLPIAFFLGAFLLSNLFQNSLVS